MYHINALLCVQVSSLSLHFDIVMDMEKRTTTVIINNFNVKITVYKI